jgi:hypothetical protein
MYYVKSLKVCNRVLAPTCCLDSRLQLVLLEWALAQSHRDRRRGRNLAVLRLHHGATIQSAVNQLFGDMIIFSLVLSKKCNFLYV